MNMKKQKILMIIILALVILFGKNVVNAESISSITYELASTKQDGYSYRMGDAQTGKIVWDIESSSNKGITKTYCLNAGTGFKDIKYRNDGTFYYYDTYNIRYDMYNLPETYRAAITRNKKDYHSILWILDNMVLQNHTYASEMKANLLKAAGLTSTDLNYSQVETVQQAALWHFVYNTNHDNCNSFQKIYKVNTEVTSSNDEVMQYVGDATQKKLEKLYNYLVNTAASKSTNSKYTSAQADSVKEISLANGTSCKINGITIGGKTRYIAGPFNIAGDSKTNYDITETVSVAYGNTSTYNKITSYSITNANGSKIANNLSSLVGDGNFYILLGTSIGSNISKIKISLQADYGFNTNADFYFDSSEDEVQPLVKITKTKKQKSYSTVASLKDGEYNLKLIKVDANDANKKLEGAQFKITLPNGTILNRTTNANGEISIATGLLPIVNASTQTIKIEEIKAPNGYVKLIGDLSLNVTIKENTSSYSVNTISLNSSNANAKYNSTTNTIEVTIGDKKIEGNYSLEIVKTDENGNIITEPAKFSINGTVYTTQQGKINKNNIKISNEGIVTYVINETEAPFGYNKFEKQIKLTVTTAINGDKYIVKNAVIEPAMKEVTLEKTTNKITIKIPNEKKIFDLSLRKYITSIDGKTVTPSREPVVNTRPLLTGTTATYTHSKEPIEIKREQNIVYAIRVYNEGNENGYVQEITDYLPDGLELVKDSEINAKYGWTTEDGKTIKTTYLKNTLLKAYNGGTTLNSAYVEVECKITNTAKNDEILTNIAEITKAVSETGLEDRDSKPQNVVLNGYTKNQEDDDDFEKVKVKLEYDLSLRKFITSVNGVAQNREPIVDTTPLKNKTATTANYTHNKNVITLKQGDVVTYKIRVYNEGQMDGYVKQIADYIPAGLGVIVEYNETYNNSWGIKDKENVKTVKVGQLTQAIGNDNIAKNLDISKVNTASGVKDVKDITIIAGEATLVSNKIMKEAIKSYDGGNLLEYKDVEIACIVLVPNTTERKVTNLAEITNAVDELGNPGMDIDSKVLNMSIPEGASREEYLGNSVITTKDGKYYVGQEDDDDFEKVQVTYFDLSLRKFISSVNGEKQNREPQVNTEKLYITNKETGKLITTAEYKHSKEPVLVRKDDKVVYTIRVYNEGKQAGYVEEITDYLPEGLQYIVDSEINKKYEWKMYKVVDGKEVETEKLEEATIIKTSNKDEALLKGFNKETKVLDYIDVKVECLVVEENLSRKTLTNNAEITKQSEFDEDSTPNNYLDKNEDDNDYEKIILKAFDLSLRKFITGVNDIKISNREPKVNTDKLYTVDEKTNELITDAEYVHSKDPIEVANTDIVTYTLRVYNEGEIEGYASEIKDNIPEGLVFLPENTINVKYGWKMYKVVDGKEVETEKPEEATIIKTNYLSKEEAEKRNENTLLNAYEQEKQLDYRDVEVSFKVTEKNLPEGRVIINIAEISKDSDKNGKDIQDEDSTPNNNDEKEDDLDIEKVIVKYFDLSLLKWVSKATVIEDGKTTVTETGYTGLEDSEPIVKVAIHRKKIDSTIVKFTYKIQVTNEGQIAGYATEITDYIPEGLEFVAEDNKDWKQDGEKVITTQLKDTLLQPGESAIVEIVFRWKNDDDNFGLKRNIAEISEDDNDKDAEDIDSTPDNKEKGEDDIDEALVMLEVKTGEGAMYITLTFTVIAIFAAGVYLIKKYVI